MGIARPVGLRGVDLGVADVRAAAAFFTDTWRLSVVGERAGSVYLRGTGGYHHILSLHPRSRAELLRVNLAAAGRKEVDALHDRVARCAPPEIRPPHAVEEPGGGYAFSFRDPDGRVVRVIAGDERHRDAGPDPDRPIKITHIVLNTPRQEAAAAFWVEALGFEVSDRSLLTFIRCNSEHHNIAFHPGKSETLHHIAFEVADIDSVMRGVGRMRDRGYPIEWGPGRHGPGNNVFAYFVGPEGFVIEYTAEVERVDDGYRVRTPEEWRYPPGHSDLWGATPPPTARMKEAQDRIGFAAEMP
jgi:catechol-2,3-dioxygenase